MHRSPQRFRIPVLAAVATGSIGSLAADAELDEALSIRPESKRETIAWTPWDMRWKGFKTESDARGVEALYPENDENLEQRMVAETVGLLTQAAILSLTSDGTRHRPVHRRVWMLESFIGRPPPPPPANVPALDKPAAGVKKTTGRGAKLEQHRAAPNCTSCRLKIDPLGVAFDNYDAIGRWRIVAVPLSPL